MFENTTSGQNAMCRKTEGGMMNGAEWLGKSFGGSSHAGSLKDFSYLFTNTLELSLELTCCKFPTRYEANGPPRARAKPFAL